MKALVLAAGQGTRLRHLTKRRSKPMLPLSGTPLLGHIVMWLQRQNVTEIAINLHHRAEMITEYLGDGSRLGVSIVYSHEDRLLGTAGAAKRLEHFLDEPFVLVYGDVVTNVQINRLWRLQNSLQPERQEPALMTLALYNVPNPTECGIVRLDSHGRIIQFVEKPAPDQVFSTLAFSGIALCDPAALAHIPVETPFDFGTDLIPHLIDAGHPILGQPIQHGEYVIDIGTLGGYLRALRVVAQGRDEADALPTAWPVLAGEQRL